MAQLQEWLEVAVKQNRVLVAEHNHRRVLEGFQLLLEHHRVQEVLRVTPDLRAALQAVDHLAAADQVVLLAVLEEDNFNRSKF